MEHNRCAHCRNPIRGRQPQVRHVGASMDFHLDCWMALHAHVQRDYLTRVQAEGLGELLLPYGRAKRAGWLPQLAIDTAVEELTELLVDEPVEAAASEEPAPVVEQSSAREAIDAA